MGLRDHLHVDSRRGRDRDSERKRETRHHIRTHGLHDDSDVHGLLERVVLHIELAVLVDDGRPTDAL